MLTYEPGERGEWLAATNAGRLVVVRMGAARSTIGSIWTSFVAGDGVQGVLDELTSGGLFQTPPFAVLTWDGSVSDGPVAVRAIVRGDITLRLTTVTGQLQQTYKDEDLKDVPVARITLPTVLNIPDVVVAKAVEFTGDTETPIDQLRAIERALKTQGFLSHGLASDGIPSRAGHGADRIDELFTRSQMVGDQEQYASAMALMARTLGFPARVVMGFAADVPEGADSVEITGTDVTAWVEVAFEGVGVWRRVWSARHHNRSSGRDGGKHQIADRIRLEPTPEGRLTLVAFTQ